MTIPKEYGCLLGCFRDPTGQLYRFFHDMVEVERANRETVQWSGDDKRLTGRMALHLPSPTRSWLLQHLQATVPMIFLHFVFIHNTNTNPSWLIGNGRQLSLS